MFGIKNNGCRKREAASKAILCTARARAHCNLGGDILTLTDKSDIYGAIHENDINNRIKHIMRQRPSLFNYGTDPNAINPELLCEEVAVDPEVKNWGNPIITVEDPLPVLGTNGAVAMDFCFQITEAEVDFHPGNKFDLPPQLDPPLKSQRFAIRARVYGGLGCLSTEVVEGIELPPPPDKGEKPPPPIVHHPKKLTCFCFDLFTVGHVEVTGSSGNQKLQGKVDGLEIVNIQPVGLENSLECYLSLLLQLVILPRTSIALEKMVFEMMNGATITLSLTPTSPAVPFNPAIEDDQIKVFIDVDVEVTQ